MRALGRGPEYILAQISLTRYSGVASPSAPLLISREGPLLTLTLNRPDRLNAVSLPLYERLLEELSAAEDDASLRCVILTGAGRAFCAGADLKAHGDGPPDGARGYGPGAFPWWSNRTIWRWCS
ncbi:MAG: enoyl-CoA hydratase/isomerase family protein [Gemmatimonadota bacterium]